MSQKLAERLNLPLEHLDMYYHDTSAPYAHNDNREAWLAKIESLVCEPSWIIEGNYKSTFPKRFERADAIIFLDFSRRLRMYRVLKRRWKFRRSSPYKRAGMPDDWEEKLGWDFLTIVWNYRKQQYPVIERVADETGSRHKVLRFTNPRQLELFLDELDDSAALPL